ncbi:response regulator [Rhodoferax sp. PAMC 29310]|uniref:response regulator n=1 Tax=Rhodoferax sp. PAMC 29310 TaxID=2822760 RepID=UPI001F0A07AB|nr:response regulator [Rhodoferax sp. PAMC 29310]
MLDDEPFMLKLMCRLLANLGFTQVTSCDNGRTALAWLDSSTEPPDLILLDLNMPEMDGLEFVRHLVERLYSGSLILISGEDERMLQAAEKLVQMHNISVLGYLRKLVKPEALYALLEKWTPFSPPPRWCGEESLRRGRAACRHSQRRAGQLLPAQGGGRHR